MNQSIVFSSFLGFSGSDGGGMGEGTGWPCGDTSASNGALWLVFSVAQTQSRAMNCSAEQNNSGRLAVVSGCNPYTGSV